MCDSWENGSEGVYTREEDYLLNILFDCDISSEVIGVLEREGVQLIDI